MTTSTINRVVAGVPAGGQFAATTRQEATANLTDFVSEGLTSAQSKALVEAHAAGMDAEFDAQMKTTNNRDDSFHAGKVNAHAEILAYALTPDDGHERRYDAQAERIVEDRIGNGYSLELTDSFDGPGHFTGDHRARMVDYLRTRADESFAEADQPDAVRSAWAYGQAEVFTDAADELEGDATQFTGGK